MKTCCVCKKIKSLDQFGSHANRRDGKQTYCKDCAKGEQTKWYYARKHKISLEERDDLLKKQYNKCAICGDYIEFHDGVRGSRTGDSAVIDHCHGKGHIRGVLCGHCNTGLGAFKDDLEIIANAFTYIENDLNTRSD